jgi:branched-chain amino acid transport system ATP-binding protein
VSVAAAPRGALAPPAGAAWAEGDLIVEVVGVTLRFGGLTSLADVTLSQRRGEILSVIGPNGAGKTSLFNCLTGVYHPQEGSIIFHSRSGRRTVIAGGTRKLKPHTINRAGIARTFQTSRLFSALTTFENVKVGAESRQKTGPIGAMLRLPRTRREERESDARVIELLEFVGLRQRANDLASSLPYGDRRRLEIARALGTGPELLLLDEPAAGTNPSEKLGLAQLIQRVNSELGVSVLLIEHDMGLVMSIAERIVVLNFGRVISAGTPAAVQNDPAVIEAYLGTKRQRATAASDGATPGGAGPPPAPGGSAPAARGGGPAAVPGGGPAVAPGAGAAPAAEVRQVGIVWRY